MEVRLKVNTREALSSMSYLTLIPLFSPEPDWGGFVLDSQICVFTLYGGWKSP